MGFRRHGSERSGEFVIYGQLCLVITGFSFFQS